MQHERQQVPVTALAFWNDDVLFSGEGTLLRAYDTSSGDLISSIQIFEDQAVHGIIVGPHADCNVILVWGGRYIRQARIIKLQDGTLGVRASKTQETEDWILDAAFCPSNQPTDRQVTCVTAHNALYNLHIEEVTADEQLSPLIPASNCILYSAHVGWLNTNKCLIASGTAFGGVIIWSCIIQQEGGVFSARPKTHYVFTAHEGSVFGVRVAPVEIARALDGRELILATCSDDRSIRLWDISDLTVESPPLTEVQQQTGFGSRIAQDSLAPPCLARVLAHLSRIWHVRFTIAEANSTGDEMSSIRLFSYGEDASEISWKVVRSSEGSHGLPYELNQISSQRHHGGKNIWSVAIGNYHNATGGADGAIAQMKRSLEPRSCGIFEIGRELLDTMFPGDNFRTYGFVGPSEVVSTTDQGRIVVLTLPPSGLPTVEQVSPPLPGLVGYSTLACTPGLGFIAGHDGAVYGYIHCLRQIIEVMSSGRKIASLQVRSVYNHMDKESSELGLLVTNVGHDIASYVLLERTLGSRGSSALFVRMSISLSIPKNFVVTSFEHCKHCDETFVILGSRNGSLAVWTFFHHQVQTEPISVSDVRLMVHGAESVTSLQIMTDPTKSSEGPLLSSTGRDGTYAAHAIAFEKAGMILSIVHQLSLPFGPNIEGTKLTAEHHIWVWGFRGKNFVVYDITSQREIKTVECGGAHRNWAFDPISSNGTFVWTKASHLFCALREEALHLKLINFGGHGREIKALAASPSDQRLLALGAESTDIKLCVIRPGGFLYLHTLRRHNTGIQHLQWSENGQFLFSSGGFEEFLIWKVQEEIPLLRKGVLCESAHPNSGTSDLRITSFDVKRDGGVAEGFIITMLYSDSVIKTWHYSKSQWALLAQGEYLTASLTECVRLNDGSQALVTGSTDGHIVQWATVTGNTMEWSNRQKTHQNAVLCMVSHPLSANSSLLLSGGDDNGIALTFISQSGNMKTFRVSHAHAAAITGLVVVSCAENRIRFASTGIDQRFKLWDVIVTNCDEGQPLKMSIKLIANGFTAVADVSGISLLPDTDVGYGLLLSGVGIDEWKML